MNGLNNPYFAQELSVHTEDRYDRALKRCVDRLHEQMATIGLRNPKIGTDGNKWIYCDGPDWVMGFQSGQYWLAYQLTGDAAFRNAAQARRPEYRKILENHRFRDHDLGFQFSLHSVADWLMTGDKEARDMGLSAAFALISRFRPEGGYIQAWSPFGANDPERAKFTNGRMIADTIQNLALLHWAHKETGIADYRDIAQIHAQTSADHLVRGDDTTFHTYLFDPATGEPMRGETHQGYADNSCWARGQAWLMHGFTQCYAYTGDKHMLDMARRVCSKAEALLGTDSVPVWDFSLASHETPHLDSSAAAVMAAGLYLLSDQDIPNEESDHWRAFGNRLLDGLLETCDLTTTEGAQGLLAHGAAHVPAGRCDAMLPYGDYYFIEALMRSQGHTQFFW
ncbi:glycoside hydrolase family 88 protein [Cohaesibacter celericrescens]|uniref:glycoside hydrolase family 88 protein n=1 Tax=Cohaesibacter celericrescens TaxID=2067669 RepID=UPI003566C3E7